ncbi:MAG TPA: DUF6798 domain-containing protein [Silvibacterium sp.]|nr:DUF6798 domain-containing protein [Silvibacterium sp.]
MSSAPPQSFVEGFALAIARMPAGRAIDGAAGIAKSGIKDRHLLWIGLITPAVLLVHGYHPFAEDAGIYVAGVRKLLEPSLYGPDTLFVAAYTRFSLFAYLLAGIVRISRVPLVYVLFMGYLASICAYLLACWTLARRIFTSNAAQWLAVALAAACLTLPIAGTSLMLADPYLTSRSFSTPLGLFALVAAIEHRWMLTGVLLVVTGLVHPLMAIYVAAFVLLFVLVDAGWPRTGWLVSFLGVMVCGGIYLVCVHAPVSAAYRQAVLSRGYLFPSQWAWFEDAGLVIPLLMYALALPRLGTKTVPGKLCLAALMLGVCCGSSAFLFVHRSGPYVLVRFQLLRGFQMVYLVGIILLGGLIGDALWKRRSRRWAACAILAAVTVSMFFTQRFTYRLSRHIELPGMAPRNPWQQAFVWIRANTPPDAVFAANPELVLVQGEDGQGFRVMTERSLLGDYKDEGVVVVFPELGERWAREFNAQVGMDSISDPDRLARLRPLGATWVLLSNRAVTSLPCPYRNAVSQVCELTPGRLSASPELAPGASDKASER